MEKDLIIAKKQARIVKSKVIDLTTLDDVDTTSRIKAEWDLYT